MLKRAEEGLVFGFNDGSIELGSNPYGERSESRVFEGTPSSPVTAMLPGPGKILIAGFANGLIGIWSLADGSRLYKARLHGPVIHLMIKDAALHAATDLGQYLRLDIGIMHLNHRTLLEEVRRQVPVYWKGGLPVLAPHGR